MFLRIIGAVAAGTTVTCIVSETFRNKFDRNIARPIRNYKRNLDDWKKFQTQEEFYEFLGDLGRGIGNMFVIEETS